MAKTRVVCAGADRLRLTVSPRMLERPPQLAPAMLEALVLVTADSTLADYDVERFDARS